MGPFFARRVERGHGIVRRHKQKARVRQFNPRHPEAHQDLHLRQATPGWCFGGRKASVTGMSM